MSAGNTQTLFINELVAKNEDIIDDEGDQDDWIELYNAEEEAVNLNGLYISDDPSEPDKFRFTEDLIIPPGGFLVLWADHKDDPIEFPNHLPFKLSSEGESLALFRKENEAFVLIDQVDFPNLPANVAYGRTTDGGEEFSLFGRYSPGQSNSVGLPYYAAQLEFSVPEGFYPAGQELSLHTLAPDAEIRYTTDGSRPNESSALYTEPILLNTSVFIRASVFVEGFAPTRPHGQFYLINNTHTLPLMHLSTDAANLWDAQKGLYIIGENGKKGNCISEERNWNQDWERSGTLTFFEPEGTIGFRKKADFKIGGGCSRIQRMKSFNVFLQDDETTDYRLFPQLPYKNYKRFKLRNSGSDFTRTMLRDGALQEMLRGEIDLDLMAYRPVLLYINGERFGVYGLREFFNDDYIKQHYGDIETDMVRNPWMYYQEVKEGNAEACDDLNEWVEVNDLSNADNYAYFASQVDINQMINYWLTEMYIANYDWPDNNMMMWRNREDPEARWRWMLYDLDSSSGYGNQSQASYNSLSHALKPDSPNWPNRPPSTLWLRKLMENENFRNEFAQRHLSFGQILFSPERTQTIIDSLTEAVRPEMNYHINFWNTAPAEWGAEDRLPCGGSLDTWGEHLDNFKNFFTERMKYVPGHYQSRLGFEGTFQLHIKHDEESGGRVVLHENKMQAPYDYQGEYFKNRPLRLEAVAKEGYVFVKWKELSVTDAVLYFSGSEAQVLTPIFVKASDFLSEDSSLLAKVFPNPAQDMLSVSYARGQAGIGTVRLVNLAGQEVYRSEVQVENYPQAEQIDLNAVPAGAYFLEVETTGEAVVEKVIIY